MFTPKHLHFQISETKKSEGIFCCALRCKKPAVYKKKNLCHAHYHRHRRIMDPVYDRWVNMKGNAAQRPWKGGIGIPFTISLKELRDFCQKTGYIIKKGMRGRICSVDRIENEEGYHIWNIQLKTAIANTKKYHNEDKHFTELPKSDEDWTPF